MRRGGYAALLGILVALLAGACGSDDGAATEGSATLQVTLATSEAKTIWPEGWAESIESFVLTLLDDEGVEAATWGPADPATEAIVFEDVPYGTWTVVAEGSCDTESGRCADTEALIIAFGESEAFEVDAEEVGVTVNATPLLGPDFAGVTGRVDLQLEWPTEQDVALVRVDSRPVDESEFSAADELSSFSSEGGMLWVQVVDAAMVENGSHVYRTRLYDAADQLVATAVEVVNVYGNFRTQGAITLSDSDFFEPDSETTPVPTETEAGNVEIDVNAIDPAPTLPLTIGCVRVADDIVCEHDGTFGGAATYAWYLNGTLIEGESDEMLTLPAEGLRPGFRIVLVVTEAPWAHSASFTLDAGIIEGIEWTYFVDFEGAGETKASYGTGTLTLSGLNWELVEAMTGATAEDFRFGARSLRMRGYAASVARMIEDKSSGLGILAFEYRRYGTDAQVPWAVEYSTNAGEDWLPVGDPFTAPATDTVQTFQESVEVAGDVRVRIRSLGSGEINRRLNIDNIRMSDFP